MFREGLQEPQSLIHKQRLPLASEEKPVESDCSERLQIHYRIQRCSESFDRHSILNDPETVSEALRRSYGDIATEINHLNKMSGIIRRADQEAHMVTAKIFQTRNRHFESSGVSAIPSGTVEPILLAHYERREAGRHDFGGVSVDENNGSHYGILSDGNCDDSAT
ncbi:hypothetical protein MKX07_007865 [Trichoderma sp. CBMAI-0711]|nr:hypothetical protein MKX07_007865 [Trichoderma sp. CBMAI-0711]